MRTRLNKFMKQRGINATEAMREIGVCRSVYYDDKKLEAAPGLELFYNNHENDFIYHCDKFNLAASKARLRQGKLADKLDINYVTISRYLSGKHSPTRNTGDYQKIEKFCKSWFVN